MKPFDHITDNFRNRPFKASQGKCIMNLIISCVELELLKNHLKSFTILYKQIGNEENYDIENTPALSR